MIFDRLALGTANFGKPYNGVRVPDDEQKRILDYCQEVGIDRIDTATAYEWDWNKAKDFILTLKHTKKDIIKLDQIKKPIFLLAHVADEYPEIGQHGLAIYDLKDKWRGENGAIVQLPYSIFDRRFEPCFGIMKNRLSYKIHVRSIFLKGKLLEKFKPWECIAFCLMNPYIDRVIIGVDSLSQLKEDLEPLKRMDAAEIHDENVLDPRKWKS